MPCMTLPLFYLFFNSLFELLFVFVFVNVFIFVFVFVFVFLLLSNLSNLQLMTNASHDTALSSLDFHSLLSLISFYHFPGPRNRTTWNVLIWYCFRILSYVINIFLSFSRPSKQKDMECFDFIYKYIVSKIYLMLIPTFVDEDNQKLSSSIIVGKCYNNLYLILSQYF